MRSQPDLIKAFLLPPEPARSGAARGTQQLLQPLAFSLKWGFQPYLAAHPQHLTGSFCLLFISLTYSFSHHSAHSVLSLAPTADSTHTPGPEIPSKSLFVHPAGISLLMAEPLMVFMAVLVPSVSTHISGHR